MQTLRCPTGQVDNSGFASRGNGAVYGTTHTAETPDGDAARKLMSQDGTFKITTGPSLMTLFSLRVLYISVENLLSASLVRCWLWQESLSSVLSVVLGNLILPQ